VSLSTLFKRGALGLAAAAALVAAMPAAHAQPNVLRVVPHSNLAVLDPIWTTAYMSRNHGYMIYDTLFGTDEKGQIKPQMVDTWTVSPEPRSEQSEANVPLVLTRMGLLGDRQFRRPVGSRPRDPRAQSRPNSRRPGTRALLVSASTALQAGWMSLSQRKKQRTSASFQHGLECQHFGLRRCAAPHQLNVCMAEFVAERVNGEV
jgi:hypothetical protein